MKRRKFIKTAAVAGIGLGYIPTIFGQESTTSVSYVGEDLDLYAVLDLFEQSENIEEFEKALNSEGQGINNLDLNEDGNVDYIKVDEIIEENTHLIILQVEITENEFQDVATIEIENKSDTDITLQAIGAEELYGENYIVEPTTESTSTTTVVHVHSSPVIIVMFRPGYRAWRSPWRWRAHPKWWRRYKRVAHTTYRSRRARNTRRARYRKTTRRRSTRARNMYSPRKKTSNKYKKTNTKQTQQKNQSKSQQQKKGSTTQQQSSKKKKKK